MAKGELNLFPPLFFLNKRTGRQRITKAECDLQMKQLGSFLILLFINNAFIIHS